MGAGSCKTPTPALVGSLSTWTWVSMGVSGHGAVGSGHRAAIHEFGVENPFDSLLASLCSSWCTKQRALDIPSASLCSDIPQALGVQGWAPRGFGVPDGAPSNVPPPSLDVAGRQPAVTAGLGPGSRDSGSSELYTPVGSCGFFPLLVVCTHVQCRGTVPPQGEAGTRRGARAPGQVSQRNASFGWGGSELGALSSPELQPQQDGEAPPEDVVGCSVPTGSWPHGGTGAGPMGVGAGCPSPRHPAAPRPPPPRWVSLQPVINGPREAAVAAGHG